eukprot:PhF_6_TR1413/c1_g1_i6/m.2468
MDEDSAATKIQSNFRGFQGRKAADTIKYDKQRQKTTQYSSKTKIRELLSHLLSLVIYHQPTDVRGFIIEELNRINAKKQSHLFDDDDIETMFDMVDITRRGTISSEQLRNACNNLGAAPGTVNLGGGNVSQNGQVTKEQFKQVVTGVLRTQNPWVA